MAKSKIHGSNAAEQQKSSDSLGHGRTLCRLKLRCDRWSHEFSQNAAGKYPRAVQRDASPLLFLSAARAISRYRGGERVQMTGLPWRGPSSPAVSTPSRHWNAQREWNFVLTTAHAASAARCAYGKSVITNGFISLRMTSSWKSIQRLLEFFISFLSFSLRVNVLILYFWNFPLELGYS